MYVYFPFAVVGIHKVTTPVVALKIINSNGCDLKITLYFSILGSPKRGVLFFAVHGAHNNLDS